MDYKANKRNASTRVVDIIATIPAKGLTFGQIATIWPEVGDLKTILGEWATFDPLDTRLRYYDPAKLRPVPTHRFAVSRQRRRSERYLKTLNHKAAAEERKQQESDEERYKPGTASTTEVNHVAEQIERPSVDVDSLRRHLEEISLASEMLRIGKDYPFKEQKVELRVVRFESDDTSVDWWYQSRSDPRTTIKATSTFKNVLDFEWTPMVMVLMPDKLFSLSKRRGLFEQHKVFIKREGNILAVQLQNDHQGKVFDKSREDGRVCVIGAVDEEPGDGPDGPKLATSCKCCFTHVMSDRHEGVVTHDKWSGCQCSTMEITRHTGTSIEKGATIKLKMNVNTFYVEAAQNALHHTLMYGNIESMREALKKTSGEGWYNGMPHILRAVKMSKIDAVRALTEAKVTMRIIPTALKGFENDGPLTLFEYALKVFERSAAMHRERTGLEGVALLNMCYTLTEYKIFEIIAHRTFEEVPMLPQHVHGQCAIVHVTFAKWLETQDEPTVLKRRLELKELGTPVHKDFVESIDLERIF